MSESSVVCESKKKEQAVGISELEEKRGSEIKMEQVGKSELEEKAQAVGKSESEELS